MNNMKIKIPEGFEIDKENSSLVTGEIVFKEVLVGVEFSRWIFHHLLINK